jgi:hypothetical protein
MVIDTYEVLLHQTSARVRSVLRVGVTAMGSGCCRLMTDVLTLRKHELTLCKNWEIIGI